MPRPCLVNPYSSTPGDREPRRGLSAALVGAGAAAAMAASVGAAHADPDDGSGDLLEFSGETIVTDDLFADASADTSGGDPFTVDTVTGLGPVELSLPALLPVDEPAADATVPELPADAILQVSAENLTPFDPADLPVPAAELTVSGTTTPEQTAALDAALGLAPEQSLVPTASPGSAPLPAPAVETPPADTAPVPVPVDSAPPVG